MPHAITIFAAADTRPAGPKGYVLAHEAKPLMVVPSSGVSRAACVETPVGQIDGVPVFRMAFGEPENVPDHSQLLQDPIFNKRPEQLSVQDFVSLTNRVEAEYI